MGNVRREPLQAQPASVSRIVSLTKPDYSAAAKRFVRWRKKKRKIKSKNLFVFAIGDRGNRYLNRIRGRLDELAGALAGDHTCHARFRFFLRDGYHMECKVPPLILVLETKRLIGGVCHG